MISDAEYAQLKREYRRTQNLALLLPVITDVVDRATRPGRIPPALAEGRSWNADSRADAAQAWIEERLLRRRDVMAAFDFASTPGPFYSSLERSFRHFLMNAAPSTEAQNLVERASALMRQRDEFDEWPLAGRSWWGLASWREAWGDTPETWNGNDDQIVAHAWACGEFVITRYGPRVGRASPILERDELSRFLLALLTRTEAVLDNARLRTVFERRFAAGTATRTVELLDDSAAANSDTSAGLEEADIEACALMALEEITPRQAEVVLRKYQDETLDQIAAELGIARGTVDNELVRVGAVAKQLAGELSAERVLEKLFDLLSKEMT
jgi:DNA-directed RNA polymerase specialized sigma24 family protein